MTTTQSPAPEPAGLGDHVEFSRRFLEHSREQLTAGDLLQASEKAWGAVSHALKAVAIQRGWNHHAHYLLNYLGEQLAEEFESPDFYTHLAHANEMHRNFYENNRGERGVAVAIDDIGIFLEKLEEVRNSPPRPFTVTTRGDQQRLRWLLGVGGREAPAIGAHSEVGFSRA